MTIQQSAKSWGIWKCREQPFSTFACEQLDALGPPGSGPETEETARSCAYALFKPGSGAGTGGAGGRAGDLAMSVASRDVTCARCIVASALRQAARYPVATARHRNVGNPVRTATWERPSDRWRLPWSLRALWLLQTKSQLTLTVATLHTQHRAGPRA